MPKTRRFIFPLLIVIGTASSSAAEDAKRWMVEVQVNGRRLEGQPVAWDARQVTLLGRGGTLWQFSPQEATNFRKTAPTFQAYSPAELRGRLLREFGDRFEVTGTGHYLVVHPRGERDQWAPRFEELYRSFIHYFRVRGFRPASPRFPLVAVVLPTHEDFKRYARREGFRVSSGVLGFYSPRSNRILLYDATAEHPQEAWHVNAETIIHEAAHQVAFNTGVHDRVAIAPRWVIEGLGTLFEARGVWNSRAFASQKQRLNLYQLQRFRDHLPQRKRRELAEFIESDTAFQKDVEAAYAHAWALTFFLNETRPREYMAYLQATNEPSAKSTDAAARREMFSRHFGSNLEVLDAQFVRYMERLLADPDFARNAGR